MSDIEQFEVIRVIGIDADGPVPGDIAVTLLVGEPSPESGEQPSTDMSFTAESASARTAFEAFRLLDMFADKKQHLGYIDYYIIGEAAAKGGIAKYTDFLTRYHETRYSSKVYIIRDILARELITRSCSSDNSLEDALDNMDETANSMSNTAAVRAIDMMNMLDDRTGASVIPAVRYKEPLNGGGDGSAGFSLFPAGYAVLDGGALAGYLEPDYARGYNFITNNVKSCPISVPDGAGDYAAFEVTQSKTDVTARFGEDGAPLEIIYKTLVNVNIAEQHTDTDIYTRQGQDEMSAKISETIRRDMLRVISRSFELGLDCTLLGERLRIKYPIKWKKIENSWREIYTALTVDVETRTEIMRVYSLREPNGSEPSAFGPP
jgi:Ger(x)C family germination protein